MESGKRGLRNGHWQNELMIISWLGFCEKQDSLSKHLASATKFLPSLDLPTSNHGSGIDRTR